VAIYGNGVPSILAAIPITPLVNVEGPSMLPSVIPPLPGQKDQRQYDASGPPTLSGFKNLSRLAVLNVNCLELIPEIQTCVANSHATLAHLSLSFSSCLAWVARETVADQSSDGTDSDNESVGPGQAAPPRSALALEAWKTQEIALARVLGANNSYQKHQVDRGKDTMDDQNLENNVQETWETQVRKLREEIFVSAIKTASRVLLSVGSTEGLEVHSEDIGEVIEKALNAYFESDVAKQDVSEGNDVPATLGTLEASSVMAQTGSSPPIAEAEVVSAGASNGKAGPSVDGLGLFSMEEEVSDHSDTDGSDVSHEDRSTTNCAQDGHAHHEAGSSTPPQPSPISVQTPEKTEHIAENKEVDKRQLMSDYIKSTRGLGLVSFGVHQIPVRASVLRNALDLHVLQSLTLLNVGNQIPLWKLLSRENQVKPLALRSIFSDHISRAFLECVSQLSQVHELLMIERSRKYRPATYLPHGTTNIRTIHKYVLRKHVGTLKRLMIRNEDLCTWDLDASTIVLLCTEGVQLEELAAGFQMNGVVSDTLSEHPRCIPVNSIP
jgi:hypothetical protein